MKSMNESLLMQTQSQIQKPQEVKGWMSKADKIFKKGDVIIPTKRDFSSEMRVKTDEDERITAEEIT